MSDIGFKVLRIGVAQPQAALTPEEQVETGEQIPETTTATFPFLRLPFELRQEVYKQMGTQPNYPCRPAAYEPILSPAYEVYYVAEWHPPVNLLLTSRQVNIEATDTFRICSKEVDYVPTIVSKAATRRMHEQALLRHDFTMVTDLLEMMQLAQSFDRNYLRKNSEIQGQSLRTSDAGLKAAIGHFTRKNPLHTAETANLRAFVERTVLSLRQLHRIKVRALLGQLALVPDRLVNMASAKRMWERNGVEIEVTFVTMEAVDKAVVEMMQRDSRMTHNGNVTVSRWEQVSAIERVL